MSEHKYQIIRRFGPSVLKIKIPQDVVDNLQKEGNLGKAIFMVDVSGSMTADNSNPLFAAVGMGICGSQLTHPVFQNRFITFESTPKWHILSEGDSFHQKVKSTLSASWGGSTNFQAAMIALVDGILMEVPTEDILNMTFDEVWQTILGVHFKGKLGRYKIKDIKTTVIDDKEFLRFFRTFKSQAQDFLRQEYNDDFSQWKEGQQTYYWIPLEDLPLAK